MDTNILNTALILGGGSIIKNQIDKGNLTGRELVYHNTDKDNLDSIKDKGILKTKSYDKNNITHKGLKGSVKTKDMGGLTYVGRNPIPALGVGLSSAVFHSKDSQNKYYNHLFKAINNRTTIEAKIPSWKMETTTNPELMGTNNGNEYSDIILDRYKKRTGKDPSALKRIESRISAEIMHKNLGPKNTHTLKESIKPFYIKDSPKYKRADKEEILDYIRNNPKRFIRGVGASSVGAGLIGLGLKKISSIKYKDLIEKQASINIPLSILGASVVMNSKDKLLGKKTLYQGTSKENWGSIKKDGLKADFGGTGASKSVGNSAYQKNSKGKIHLTAMRPIANTYASVNTPEISKLKDDIANFKNKRMNIKVHQGEPGKSKIEYKLKRGYHKPNVDKIKSMEEKLRGMNIKQRNDLINVLINPSIKTDGKTIKINMDYDDWKNKMTQDREGVMFKKQINKLRGDNNPLIKNMAAKGNFDVPIENISGSDASVKDKFKHTLDSMPNYIKNNPDRFARGLIEAGLGALILKKGFK